MKDHVEMDDLTKFEAFMSNRDEGNGPLDIVQNPCKCL